MSVKFSKHILNVHSCLPIILKCAQLLKASRSDHVEHYPKTIPENTFLGSAFYNLKLISSSQSIVQWWAACSRDSRNAQRSVGNWLGQDKNNYSTKMRWQLNFEGNQPLNAQPICQWSACYIKRLTLFICNNDSGPWGDIQCRESPYIVGPILEAGELRLREIEWLAQNDLTGWKESQDSKHSQAFKPHGATSK